MWYGAKGDTVTPHPLESRISCGFFYKGNFIDQDCHKLQRS
jgi:hypothetical protein